MKLAHAQAVAVAVPSWCVSLMWLWPRAAIADAALSSEVLAFDWVSLGYASGLGLLGGLLAFIVALATDQRVVMEVAKEGGRNAIVSPIGGAAMYALLKACAGLHLFSLSTEPRFLLIVGAGYAGIATIQWARSTTGTGAAAFREWLIERLKT